MPKFQIKLVDKTQRRESAINLQVNNIRTAADFLELNGLITAAEKPALIAESAGSVAKFNDRFMLVTNTPLNKEILELLSQAGNQGDKIERNSDGSTGEPLFGFYNSASVTNMDADTIKQRRIRRQVLTFVARFDDIELAVIDGNIDTIMEAVDAGKKIEIFFTSQDNSPIASEMRKQGAKDLTLNIRRAEVAAEDHVIVTYSSESYQTWKMNQLTAGKTVATSMDRFTALEERARTFGDDFIAFSEAAREIAAENNEELREATKEMYKEALTHRQTMMKDKLASKREALLAPKEVAETI